MNEYEVSFQYGVRTCGSNEWVRRTAELQVSGETSADAEHCVRTMLQRLLDAVSTGGNVCNCKGGCSKRKATNMSDTAADEISRNALIVALPRRWIMKHAWIGELGNPNAHCPGCRIGRTVETEAIPCEGTCLCQCGHHIDEHGGGIHGEFADWRARHPYGCGTGRDRTPASKPCECSVFRRASDVGLADDSNVQVLAAGEYSVAIGGNAQALASRSIAIGHGSVAKEPGYLAIGPNLLIRADGKVLIKSVEVGVTDPRIIDEMRCAMRELFGVREPSLVDASNVSEAHAILARVKR